MSKPITDDVIRAFQRRLTDFYAELPELERLLLGDLIRRAVRGDNPPLDSGGVFDDSFVESCNAWVVPYIGDLLGDPTAKWPDDDNDE